MSSKKRGSGNIRNSDKTTTIVPTASSKWTSSNAMENTVNIVGRMQPFNNITEHDLREACERHDSTDYTNYDWQNAHHTDNKNDKAGINISNVAYPHILPECTPFSFIKNKSLNLIQQPQNILYLNNVIKI